MRKSKTHFEQIPVEEVKKVVKEEEVSTQKQDGAEEITDVITDPTDNEN